ncbi:MAG TPA: antibiotic biosynthesis monooxygenase [Microcoleaceae cyanobacterium]|jgi:heme-degrading monooxygenase HmoA
MSEFQDFLKHQYAYVAVGEFKPGKFAQAQHLYEQAVSTYTDGFRGAYLLRDPGTDKGISVIFWESVEQMAHNESAEYQAILKQMAPLFAQAPQTYMYEVVTEIQGNQKPQSED